MKKGENIYKRKDGRWEGRFIKERDYNGKIIYGYVYGRHYVDVKQKLIQKRAQSHEKKETALLSNKTLDEWIAVWLSNTSFKASTLANYRGKIERYISPAMGLKQLEKLTYEDCQLFIYQLQEKQLANSTIQSIFYLLKQIIHYAIKEGVLVQDPCKYVNLAPVQKTAISALSKKAQYALQKEAVNHKHGLAVIIALYTGMRIGEISGLRWSDIDWVQNKILVRRTVSRIPSASKKGRTELIVDTPKTHSSLRDIPLPPNLKVHLRQEKKKSAGSYVISCKGHLTEPRIITYRFKKILQAAGVSPVRFHSLRHTFATRCLEQGADILTKLDQHLCL